MAFERAVRSKTYMKIGIMGPSGSGKSYSGLLLAKGLAQGGKIAAIDTENRSLSLFSHLCDFDVQCIEPPFVPKKAVMAIEDAVKGGYKVLMLDGQTRFWKYILEIKEALDRQGGNSYTNWGRVKPQYEELKDAILQAPIDMIVCMRAKEEYVLELNAKGKSEPKKVGMGAIMEPGAEYEHSVVFSLGMDHYAVASKDRTDMFDGEVFRITEETGQRFVDWLATGAPMRLVTQPDPENTAGTTTAAQGARSVIDSWSLTPEEQDDLKQECKLRGLKFSECLIAADRAGVEPEDGDDDEHNVITKFFDWLEDAHPLGSDDSLVTPAPDAANAQGVPVAAN